MPSEARDYEEWAGLIEGPSDKELDRIEKDIEERREEESLKNLEKKNEQRR